MYRSIGLSSQSSVFEIVLIGRHLSLLKNINMDVYFASYSISSKTIRNNNSFLYVYTIFIFILCVWR